MLKYLTTVVAALTPLMYFHGATFHDGYLRALGIPPDLFKLSFESVLVQGFLAYVLLGIPALLLLFLYLAVALGTVYNLNEASKISFIKRVVSWISCQFKSLNLIDETEGHHVTEKTIKWVSYALLIVLALLIVVCAILGLAIKADELGKATAESNIKSPQKSFVLQELHLSNGSTVRGYTLECSDYGCAILAGKRVQIIPLEKIESIDALL